MARTDSLTNYLTDLGAALREKTGTSDLIPANTFDTVITNIQTKEDLSTELTTQSTLLTNQGTTIDDIKLALQNKTAGSGEEVVLQEKTITPSTSQQNVIADTGYNGLSKVVVNPVTSAIDSDIKATNIRKGINILGVTGTLEESVAEDLTGEFNEYESALSTQETTIDDIISALQGKTAGGSTGGGTNIQNISVKSPLETFSYYLAGYSYFDETTGTIQYFNDMNIENYYKQENFGKEIKVLPNSIFILTSIGTGTGYGMGNVIVTGADDSECLFVSGNYAFVKIGTADTTLEWALNTG